MSVTISNQDRLLLINTWRLIEATEREIEVLQDLNEAAALIEQKRQRIRELKRQERAILTMAG